MATISIRKQFVLNDTDILTLWQDKHPNAWLVLFCSHKQCGACKTFRPIWANAIWDIRREPRYKAIDSQLWFIEVDMGSRHPLTKLLEEKHGVSDYPTVLAFPPGSDMEPRSAHELLLYRENQPPFLSTLTALVHAHTPVSEQLAVPSSSSLLLPSSLSTFLCSLPLISDLPDIIQKDAQMVRLPCSLDYCRIRKEEDR